MELAREVKRVFEYFNPDLDIMDEENDDVTTKINEIVALSSQLPILRGFADLRSRFTALSICHLRGVPHAKNVIEYAYPNGFSANEYYKMTLRSLSLVINETVPEDKRTKYDVDSVNDYATKMFKLIEHVETKPW